MRSLAGDELRAEPGFYGLADAPRASERKPCGPEGCGALKGDDLLAAQLGEHAVVELGPAIRWQVVDEGS